MRMPWGKFKGEDLEDIESSYLLWVLENCEIKPGLEVAIHAELRDRFGGIAAPAPEKLDKRHRPMAQEILKAGYRAVLQRVHPDHGGKHDDTIAVQAAYEALASYVGGKEKG